jgi:serine/threonine-protein kinase RsbW
MPVGGSNHQGGRHAGRTSNGAAAAGKLVFTINSNHHQSLDVQRQILDRVEKAGFTGREFFGIKLALDEAVANAIRHGNKLDPAKHVRIEARVSPKKVELLIEDEGIGFDRRGVPDPTSDENLEKCTGRGILLIESYMSKVWWDRGGRRLRMVKERVRMPTQS